MIAHDIELGQVYEDSRTGDRIQLVYLDNNVYLLQNEDDEQHRLGTYDEFHENVESGRYNLLPDDEPFANTGVLSRIRERRDEYENTDGRTAAHKAEAFAEALEILTDMEPDVSLEDVDFESFDGIGEKGAQNLRDAGYKTERDIRNASDDDLLDVSWVGEKGVNALREAIV